MNKMDGMSMNLIGENVEQLKRLFPEAVTEGKIDFEVLKALLGGEIETRQEYYKFTWNGKEAARAYARTRSMGTLRPCVEESSGKDGTPGKFDSENLYIEGDNLEVLKLLQGAYHKKVKMIYIDPPYNTGKDFVYPDNYRDSIKNYKELTGQTDAEGKSTRANPETSGRYHTDWLNMMYSRLILARNLLSDDGVIFISIDENEISNLRKICDDVLGEENFIANITLLCNPKGRSQDKYIANCHEYILVYSKSILPSDSVSIPKSRTEIESDYPLTDSKGRVYRELELRNTHRDFGKFNRPKLWYPIYVKADGSISLEEEMGAVPIYPVWDDGFEGCWTWGMDKTKQNRDLLVIKSVAGKMKVYRKAYAFNDDLPPRKQVKSIWTENIFFTEKGQATFSALFEAKEKIFQSPKSILTLLQCIQMSQSKDSIILDFFSGSATTAHAVMKLNAEDGGNRKYIMVQLPEPCEEGTEAARAGYKNICEIGKERIRRAAKKIREENPLACQNQDMGFKVFKLDTSNLLPWNPDAETLEQDLYNAVDNVLADRTTDDLLYEILLKCNLPLTLPIEKKQFGGNTVYIVGMGALAICLDKPIPATIADEIVKLRDEYAPIVPMQVVFRDNGFDDVSKTNALQILKQAGFEDKSIQTI